IGLCRTSVLGERQESGISFTKVDCYYRANRKGNENRNATRESRRSWQRIWKPGIQETYVIGFVSWVCWLPDLSSIVCMEIMNTTTAGFVVGDGLPLGLISNNMADTWLQLAIAVVSLIIGFAPSGETTAAYRIAGH